MTKTTSLLDDAIEASRVDSRGPRCATCVWLADLPDRDREDVEAALAAPISQVKHTVLFDLIDQRWPDSGLSRDSMVNHRRGRCRGTR